MTNSPMPGPGPPTYPLRYTYPQAVKWTIAALTDKPVNPEFGESPSDLRIRRLVERHVLDRRHREQLKAWCRGQGGEASFRAACSSRDWNRDTAQKNVDRALGMVFMMMNLAGAEV